VDLGRLLGRGEQHLVAVHAEHSPQLKTRRRDGDPVHGQMPGALQISVGDEGARAGARRQAGDQLHPALVASLVQDPRLAVDRIYAEKPDGALIAGLHDGVRAVAVPAGAQHVFERAPIPTNLGPRTVQPHDPQRDVGVGRAGRRIAHRTRRLAGIGRVREVPQLDRRRIDPRHHQPVTVRSPPEPARATRRRGARVLGDSEHEVRPVGRRDRAVCAAVRLDHPHRTAIQVRDPPAGRVGPRIDHRTLGGQAPDPAVGDTHRPQTAGQCEGNQPGGIVGGIGVDPGALLRLRACAEQVSGIGELPLRPIVEIQRPQAGHRIVARTAAQKQHRRTVQRDRELCRDTQGEAPRTDKLAGQRDHRHARHSATAHSPTTWLRSQGDHDGWASVRLDSSLPVASVLGSSRRCTLVPPSHDVIRR
jgi:hypothetical protein